MNDHKVGKKPNFPKPTSVGPRPWGEEELLFVVPSQFMLKKLFVKAGNKGGLQYHRLKNEGGYLVSGKMIIRFDNGAGGLTEKIIEAGDCFHFPPGVVHQEEAITDCVIIEGSTPHFNDRVRCEEVYGLEAGTGLPTTSKEDIEIK